MPDLKLAASKTIDHSQRGQEAMLDARQRMAAAGGAQGIFCALFFSISTTVFHRKTLLARYQLTSLLCNATLLFLFLYQQEQEKQAMP